MKIRMVTITKFTWGKYLNLECLHCMKIDCLSVYKRLVQFIRTKLLRVAFHMFRTYVHEMYTKVNDITSCLSWNFWYVSLPVCSSSEEIYISGNFVMRCNIIWAMFMVFCYVFLCFHSNNVLYSKTLLRLAISRIKLLRNKRDVQLKQMKRELVKLLQSDQEPSARIRVSRHFEGHIWGITLKHWGLFYFIFPIDSKLQSYP